MVHIEVTKEHVGKTVYLEGTSNAANRYGVTPLKEAIVKKVNPKTAIFELVANGHELKLGRNGSNPHNFSYHIWETVDDYKAEKLVREIRNLMDSARYNPIETDLILKVAEILDLNCDVEFYKP